MIPDIDWWRDPPPARRRRRRSRGAIGLERELRDRAAGLRTHMLVGVGAALFTIVSAYGWSDFEFSARSGVVFDPTRIAAQIVTGIGFLGAGAIIRQGLTVRGLTTAASLWIVAAIGMAAGAGFYSAAADRDRHRARRPGAVPLARGQDDARRASGAAGARSRSTSTREHPIARAARRDRRQARRASAGSQFEDERDRPRPPRRARPAARAGRGAPRRGARVARGRARGPLERDEGELRLEEPRTRRGSSPCSCPAGRSSRPAPTSCPRRSARPSTRTRARRRCFGRRVDPPDRWAIGEDSGLEVDGARRAARDLLGPLRGARRDRRGERGEAARGARRRRPATAAARATSPSSSASRPTAASVRGTGTLEGTIADGAARLRGLRLRPRLRPGGRGADGRRAGGRLEGARTATARAPRRACSRQ